MKNRKPFVWPSLRNKPKAVKPEPQNVTEALLSTQVEKPLRGVSVDHVVFDEVQEFLKDAAPEPLKGSLTPETLEEVSVFAPGAVIGENLEVLAVIEPSTEVTTEPTPVAAPVESLPDVPSDLGVEKVVKWSQAMSKAELLKIAQDLGLALDDTPTKAEIVEALKAHDSIA